VTLNEKALAKAATIRRNGEGGAQAAQGRRDHLGETTFERLVKAEPSH